MSWYRKIDVRMHGDKRFRRLSDPQPCGKYLWMYLLTGSHTSDGLPGLYPVGRADLASRLKWGLVDFDQAWAEIASEPESDALPMAIGDWECHVVWVPNSIRYNPPESPNVVKGWVKPFDLIPECDLRQRWVMRAMEELEAVGPGHVKAFAEAFREALREGLPKGCGQPIANPQPQPQPQPQEDGAAQLEIDATQVALNHDPILDEIVIMMPVKSGDFPITERMVRKWETLYGNIDVRGKLRHMAGHWESKSLSHRKTYKGIKTSINTWLAKDSDRGGSGGLVGAPRHSNRDRNDQVMRDAIKEM